VNPDLLFPSQTPGFYLGRQRAQKSIRRRRRLEKDDKRSKRAVLVSKQCNDNLFHFRRGLTVIEDSRDEGLRDKQGHPLYFARSGLGRHSDQRAQCGGTVEPSNGGQEAHEMQCIGF